MSFARHDFASIKAAFDRVKLALEEVEKHSDETRDDIVANSRRRLLPISICLLEGLVEDKFKDAQKHCDSAVLDALESGYAYHSEKFFQYKDDYSYFTQKTLYEENHKNLNRVQNLMEEFDRSLKVLDDQGCTDENVTETVKLHANFADRLQDFTRDLREAFDQKTRDDADARGKEKED